MQKVCFKSVCGSLAVNDAEAEEVTREKAPHVGPDNNRARCATRIMPRGERPVLNPKP